MRKCQICGKGSMIQQSGAHKYGGGWAMRATKKRRVWMPNLHSARVIYEGVHRTMRLCSKCLRRVKASMPKPVVAIPSEAKEKQSQKTEILITPKIKVQAPVATA